MDNKKNIIFSGEIFIKSDDISDKDIELSEVKDSIENIDKELDRLISHADKTDYLFATASGTISALIDSLFVPNFSFENANKSGENTVKKIIIKAAKFTGCKSMDVKKCVKHLEKFKIPGDVFTSEYGGGKQHHLRDFSHHFSIDGLFFSILTQFTGCVYGTDTKGNFLVEKLSDNNFKLIGDSFIEKLNNGVINWFFHLASDMLGASDTLFKDKIGTGIPGPFLSLLKDLSSLPFLRKNDKGIKILSLKISKLYNGTLLGSHDQPIRFNLNTEIGIIKHFGRQSIPVILNEIIVRLFYSFRHLILECSSKNIFTLSNLNKINWDIIAPWNNHTINRMLTVSSMTFNMLDITDAAVRGALECGCNPIIFCTKFASRFNYVGAGRAVFAVYKEFTYEIETIKKLCEKRELTKKQTALVIEKIEKYKDELQNLMCEYVLEDLTIFIEALDDIDRGIKNNDSNLVIKGNILIQNKFGVKEQFSNQKEFDDLMDSNDDFIL